MGQRGKIIRGASSAVMDPNQDGFVSKTTSGFSNDGSYVDEFEITMFGIPQLGGDVAGDNSGNSCGINDLIPDNQGRSVYAVKDGNNLIFRFRVGDDNPSVESWSILLDTDGLFGVADPNATAGNPGFEVDITFIKRNNAGVYVYDINGIENCPTPLLSYPISSNFQISIADEVTCGDPDYFYDFFIPFDQLASTFGIASNAGLRFVAVTNVSATCAVAGNIADVSGVDNNAPEYNGCVNCAFLALVENQCPTPIDDLCQMCGGFQKDKVNAPTIDTPVRAGQTIISGTSDTGIYIVVEIYSRTGGTDAAPIWSTIPRESKSNYAVGILWAVTLSAPLQSYDRIIAKAQKDATSIPCGVNGANQASASVTVVQPNTHPTAQPQTVNLQEDTPANIVMTGTDPQGDALVYTIVSPPINGTLSGLPPNITYIPNLNYSGSDSFTFQVSDGIFFSLSPGTVTINVSPVNDAPIADHLSKITLEDTPVATVLTASDVDGNALTFIIVTPPTHGTLTGIIPNLTYSPNSNYFGQDSFTFSVNDGTVNSTTATVSITITSVGDAPSATPQNIAISEDSQVDITLGGVDPEGDALTFSIVTPPASGTLTGSGPNIKYTPDINFNGADGFTFKVNDGLTDSGPATVAIIVTPVNDLPIAFTQSIPFNLNTPKAVTLTASDADGDPLSYVILTTPTNGSLSGTAPNVIYTPNTGFTGSDSFTFKVNDGVVDSNIGTITLNLAPLSNVPPVAFGQAITTPEDVPYSLNLVATDANGDPITYIIQPPSHGTLVGVGSLITYLPAPDYSGPDNFNFKVNDGSFDSNTATITITVVAVNDIPIANPKSVSTAEDSPLPIVLGGTDVENSPLNFILLTAPAHGTLTGTGSNITYTPAANFNGADNFSFKVNDGTDDSHAATVSLTITPVSDAPIAFDQSGTLNSTLENVPKTITLVGVDPDGDQLNYIITSPPSNGALTISGANVTYTPASGFNGSDSFTFKANDGVADSNIATVSINVIPLNYIPVATPQTITTLEDTPKSILLAGSDGDSDPITYSLLSQPINGMLSGTAPNLTYTPLLNFNGSDSFTFSVSDGTIVSSGATVSIAVTPVNDPPLIAMLPLLYTKEDSTLQVCLNVTDAEGGIITFLSPNNIKGGGTMVREAAPFDFCYRFTPEADFNGESEWDMRVSDADGLVGSSHVSIIVLPVNDSPVAVTDSILVNRNSPKSGDVLINDYDIEGDALTVSLTPLIVPLHGEISLTSNGTFTYVSDRAFRGIDSVVYEVCDNGLPVSCSRGTLIIDVGDLPFKVYEGITPNGDGANDYLRIEGIDFYSNNVVQLFDRFNNLVFEITGYDNEEKVWRGQSNKGIGPATLPEGTYFYQVKLGDGSDPVSGFVVLKKN